MLPSTGAKAVEGTSPPKGPAVSSVNMRIGLAPRAINKKISPKFRKRICNIFFEIGPEAKQIDRGNT